MKVKILPQNAYSMNAFNDPQQFIQKLQTFPLNYTVSND